jgi:hypothetical protein
MLFCPFPLLNSRAVAIPTDSNFQAMISSHPHQSVKKFLDFLDISSHLVTWIPQTLMKTTTVHKSFERCCLLMVTMRTEEHTLIFLFDTATKPTHTCIILYYFIYHIVSHHIPYHISLLYYITLYYTIPYHIILYYIILYYTIPYYIILYYIILYYIILHTNIPSKYLGYSCGHPHGGELWRINYKTFLNQYTNGKYWILKCMV